MFCCRNVVGPENVHGHHNTSDSYIGNTADEESVLVSWLQLYCCCCKYSKKKAAFRKLCGPASWCLLRAFKIEGDAVISRFSSSIAHLHRHKEAPGVCTRRWGVEAHEPCFIFLFPSLSSSSPYLFVPLSPSFFFFSDHFSHDGGSY